MFNFYTLVYVRHSVKYPEYNSDKQNTFVIVVTYVYVNLNLLVHELYERGLFFFLRRLSGIIHDRHSIIAVTNQAR